MNNQSMTASVQKEAAEKLIGKFNRSPIVFDEACDLSATVQIFFSRMFSKLWGDGNRLWKGSYRALAQLCRVSVGMAHAALEALTDAGLLVCEALGKDHGDTPTLTIKLSLDRLWKLNERYSKFTEAQREEFCQRYAWKTLKKLEKDLSEFERERSKNEQYRSKNERSRSNSEHPHAQRRSKNEQYRSKNERQNGLEDAPQADVGAPTDVDTDTNTTTDVVADSESALAPTNNDPPKGDYSQGYGGTIRDPCEDFTEEGQAFYELYCQQSYVVVKPSINEKLVSECNMLGKHVKTCEELKTLDTVARKQLPKGATNNYIYLKNLINALNAWKQAQESSRQRSESPTQPLSAEEEEQRQARIAAIKTKYEQSKQGGILASG